MESSLKYSCLFGGGAIRGLAFVGVIRAMEELGIEIETLAGSSVGAIFALLLACGYKSYELENLFLKVNFELFKDIKIGFKTVGISKGEIFTDWINELISKKLGTSSNTPLTFKDLKKDFIVITTNIKEFTPQEFSRYSTPDYEVAKAVKISSSMPGLMSPVEYNGLSLVDGDLLKPSPMWKLSSSLSDLKGRILELRLEGTGSDMCDQALIPFMNTLYSCFTQTASNFVTEIYGGNDKYDILPINTGDVIFANLNLGKEERRKIIDLGYEQTMNYFKNILPNKKERILSVYEKSVEYLKSALNGLKSGNVEETQWWFGDLFMLLCENKELVAPEVYEDLIGLKKLVWDSVYNLLFITKFKKKRDIQEKMVSSINLLLTRIADIKYYLDKFGAKES